MFVLSGEKTSATPSARVLKQVRGNNIFVQDACQEDYKMITDEAVIPAILEAEAGDAQVQAGQLNETLSKRGRELLGSWFSSQARGPEFGP